MTRQIGFNKFSETELKIANKSPSYVVIILTERLVRGDATQRARHWLPGRIKRSNMRVGSNVLDRWLHYILLSARRRDLFYIEL